MFGVATCRDITQVYGEHESKGSPLRAVPEAAKAEYSCQAATSVAKGRVRAQLMVDIVGTGRRGLDSG